VLDTNNPEVLSAAMRNNFDTENEDVKQRFDPEISKKTYGFNTGEQAEMAYFNELFEKARATKK